ncbi:LysR family transcriptional regulator [Paludibacterium purpuratum]|uniref:LysR family transcriptional regulator n=1 Tax=Paludibacterium purpuratum TaxID=1144873 RepID=A0A4R7BAL0_9NEIS|nr:LysR family transcriptional regulator [Paludibacterium purpuratum]TDR81918.1 LysR family transcriptional regulator [Paludibacterium purpuratum]
MKRLPPLEPLHAFLAVVRHGSFSAAADQLNLSQSAISRQIERLETHFRCRLFERHTRLVVLTPQGQRLVPFAEQVLVLLDQAERAMVETPRVLTVRVHPTLAVRWLLPRLPSFYRLNPGVTLAIDTQSLQVPDFFRENIDAMIDFAAREPSDLQTDVLWQESMTPVCRPDYLDDLDGLAGATLLHPDRDGKEWRRWAALADIDLNRSRHQFSDMLEVALVSAQQGQGIALADTWLVEDLVASGALQQPFPIELSSGLAYRLSIPPAMASDAPLSSFRSWLLDQVHSSAIHAQRA